MPKAVDPDNAIPETEPLSETISPATADEESLRDSNPYRGLTLNDRYLIDRKIGSGGIGAVYLARDQKLLSKPVVIKVILEQPEESDHYNWLQQKFRQEMEALARIDHPGVVGVLDTGEMPDKKPFLVMQFVEGVDLRLVIKSGRMELARVADIIRQTGHALNAAHEKGILHRDIKPANIMLQPLGEGQEHVKLIDFGIATVKDSHFGSDKEISQVAGTIAYMAPEQLLGRPTASSDIYALGVVAYEMVTGRRPFNPESPFQLLELEREGVKIKPREVRPDLPESAQGAILKALAFDTEDRFAKARDFGDTLAEALLSARADGETVSLPSSLLPSASLAGTVVMVYKRGAEPDERLLKLIEGHLLENGYRVFIDKHLPIGIEWAKELERQIRSSDAVIVLLSAVSAASEMLSHEVQIASEAAHKRSGRPRLLPVRVDFDAPLPDSIAGILNPLQQAVWRIPEDDHVVLAQLLASLQAPLPPQHSGAHPNLEPVGGAVPLDSEFYIVRPADDEFCSAIARRDSIVLVKGARQMGKTSLLARGLQQARDMGARVVLTDFQTLNALHFESLERLFLTLAELIADQLDLDVSPSEVWHAERGPSVNFGRYIRREVMGKVPAPVVWGMDEVDRLFNYDYASEVFGLFRSWHNARSLDPSGPWHRLTLAIAYATEAHLFITDVNQSPFNVGTRLALEDFTIEQVEELNRRYGSPLRRAAELARFYALVGGHPYLVRRSLHEIVTTETVLSVFETHADRDEGPLGDHLRRILLLLSRDQNLCDVVRGVLEGRACPDAESFYRLRSAGVLAGDTAEDARLRCQLYSTYLKRHL
ncbi:MAG: AAA-like domain-containing protein [Blastocatellia bacterium]|nr:AAA-like domain-containing protein [Blastocatellia bacterium]